MTEMHGGEAGHTKCHPHQGVSDVGEPSTDLKDNLERCRSFHPVPSLLPVFDLSVFLAEEKA